jgi:16S rRNA (uracil1498-N3)-methyltransferase
MIMQRYFMNKKDINKFIITGDDYHHITKVMRMKLNDEIEIIYNKELYICNIIEINNHSVICNIKEHIKENNELEVDITIAQSLVKEEKLEYIFQKGTELGVNNFILINSERSIVKIEVNKQDKKIVRWQKICKEASEQSKRNIIPNIVDIVSIKQLVNLEYDYKILCSVNEKTINIKTILPKLKKDDKIIVVIGPEGGFTDKEEQYLINNGFISVSLGNRVLRTETASLYVASLINYELMR